MQLFITGVTGLVGGELLIRLAKNDQIDKIFCLVRADNELDAQNRVKDVFLVHNDFFPEQKIIGIPGDLGDDLLTQSLLADKRLENIDFIIHSAANTSFSRFHNEMIEKINIGGLEKIVTWAITLQKLKTFLYVGTATICGKDKKHCHVYENESPNINAHHLVRYTYTKMQGELLLEKSFTQDKLLIVRPSIIMGDSRDVTPRSPVIIWALATFNAMRICAFAAKTKIDIVPVDYVTDAIEKLMFAKRKYHVYHISSSKEFATTPEQLLEALKPYYNYELEPLYVGKDLMNKLKLWSKGNEQSEEQLKDIKSYLDLFEEQFDDKSNMRIILSGLEPYIDFIRLEHTFDHTRLYEDTDMYYPTPAHEYIVKSVAYMKKINLLEGAYNP